VRRQMRAQEKPQLASHIPHDLACLGQANEISDAKRRGAEDFLAHGRPAPRSAVAQAMMEGLGGGGSGRHR
jgi:hypothetical protein